MPNSSYTPSFFTCQNMISFDLNIRDQNAREKTTVVFIDRFLLIAALYSCIDILWHFRSGISTWFKAVYVFFLFCHANSNWIFHHLSLYSSEFKVYILFLKCMNQFFCRLHLFLSYFFFNLWLLVTFKDSMLRLREKKSEQFVNKKKVRFE